MLLVCVGLIILGDYPTIYCVLSLKMAIMVLVSTRDSARLVGACPNPECEPQTKRTDSKRT